MINFSSTKPAIESVATFSQMPGIVFEYPVFRGWGVRRTEQKSDDECVLWLDWPSTIMYEVAPRILVTRFADGNAVPPSTTIAAAAPNGFDVGCERVFFPADYVQGYDAKGYWDALLFRKTAAAESVLVRIPSGSDHGFSRELFAEKVAATFRFT